jgi:hypothetical protein
MRALAPANQGTRVGSTTFTSGQAVPASSTCSFRWLALCAEAELVRLGRVALDLPSCGVGE